MEASAMRAYLVSDGEEILWEQVLARSGTTGFVYAVRTTGVYCRPSCPSRRPARAHVSFYKDSEDAQAAGFRACLRCRPDAQPAEMALIERLTAYLEHESERTVSLAELGRVAGYAPATVQRIFVRVLGLSPRAWVNARRAEAYRNLLGASDCKPEISLTPSHKQAIAITDAVYAAGFSGPSRAYEAAPLGMEARRFRARGAGERIGYAIGETGPRAGLGKILVAATERGVCAVLLGDDERALVADLTSRFRNAELAEDRALSPYLASVLADLHEHPSAASLPLDLRGTAFQARVWAALREIPRGVTRSYASLANTIGAPRAVRAVARACAQNPAAIVVPCHRVVGADGKLTGYRWGVERKRALLALESAKCTGLPIDHPGSSNGG